MDSSHEMSFDVNSEGQASQNELRELIASVVSEIQGEPSTGPQRMSFGALSANAFVDQPFESMDPHLQRLVAQHRSGEFLQAGVSRSGDEVSVIARVTDVEKWEELSEVRVGATIDAGDEDNDAIVTGRIPVSRLGAIRQQDFITSLKAARPLFTNLSATTDELNSRPHELPSDLQSAGTGEGVVIGIIDYGCDFAHRNFLNSNGTTRFLAIWDQSGPDSNDSPFGYGKVYDRTAIDAALQSNNPYSTLGYGPQPDSPFRPPGTHGTHVADIAAGNGNGSGVAGVAPAADLVFVDVSHSDLFFRGRQVVGQSFGDSTRLLEALKYIFDLAGDRPCVINISLGTNGGPHDGSTPVEQGIDRLVEQKVNRSVTISASNSFADGIHAAGTVAQGQFTELVWRVSPSDTTHNEFELWYSGADSFDVEIVAPDGSVLGRVSSGQTLPLSINNRMALFATNRVDDPNNHDNTIGIFLERRFTGWNPTGNWRVRIHGIRVANGGFHAWIERDDASPSQFATPHDNTHTIGSISCGQKTVVVGSYDAHKNSRPLSFFSSAGPTRDGRQKPEVSAPGHAVLAAHSRTSTRTVRKSGTSMAAPAVAGVCALVYAEAQSRGVDLSIDQLRTILESACRRNPPFGSDWDDRYGNGRLSAERAIQAVIDLAANNTGQVSTTKSTAPKKSAKKPGKRKTRKKAARA